MNKKQIFAFLLGAAVGSAITYYILKRKKAVSEDLQEDDAQVEKIFDPVTDTVTMHTVYSKAETKVNLYHEISKPEMRTILDGYSPEEKVRYDSILRLYATNEGDPEEETKSEQEFVDDEFFEGKKLEAPSTVIRAPQVISPDEFGAGEYSKETLYYYEDGVIADDEYIRLDKPSDYVGDVHIVRDAMRAAIAMEDDCIYIRNERLHVDFELLRQDETYDEFLERRPDKKVEVAYV